MRTLDGDGAEISDGKDVRPSKRCSKFCV